MRKTAKKPVTSMRGVTIDLDAMRASNEHLVAIGNAKMNARGDKIGAGGKIEISREQIVQDYYQSNPHGVRQASLKAPLPDTFESPAEAIARLTPAAPVSDVDAPTGLLDKKQVRKLIDKED
jgi:hypothetical protein